VGSLLNVVIPRVPQGRSVVHPGSACPRCGKPIAWFDNIPLLSYALLRARCRNCGEPISLRYPLADPLTGLLFVLAAWELGGAFTSWLASHSSPRSSQSPPSTWIASSSRM